MKQITICCPECKEPVYRYDGKSESKVQVYCKSCKNILAFNPEFMSVKIIGKNTRNTSSGMRFY